MYSPIAITPEELDRWADTPDGKFMLPALVRRLVLATAQPRLLDGFREGGGGFLPGHDGVIDCLVGNPFVPEGKSLWELGTERHPARKAALDYTKRTNEIAAENRSSTSIVLVGLRRWSGSSNWAAGKRALKEWSDVRVLDADGLRAWLDLAPTVELWLASRLGRALPGVTLLTEVAREFRAVCAPELPRELLTAGRESVAEELRSRLKGPPGVIAVRGDTADEALAFVEAALSAEDDPLIRERLLARTVVVSEDDAARALSVASTPCVLVFRGVQPPTRAIASGHHGIVLLRADDKAKDALVLAKPRRDAVSAALRAAGMDERRADRYAREVHGSIEVLRRRLATVPTISRPEWTQPQFALELAPLLLFDSWNDEGEADRELVSLLCGRAYSDVELNVRRWLGTPDPPLERVGHVFRWVCREDAWLLLSRFLTLAVMRRFRDAAGPILTEIDPRYELPEEERFLAPLKGKVRQHSGAMRAGLAETAALLATRMSDAAPDLAQGAELTAQLLVRDVTRASMDYRLWASISEVAPSLAEAAPDEFLGAIERWITESPGNVSILLRGEAEEPFFGGSCFHAGLLWALETLVWEPRLLGRAALTLARLAAVDPGGRWANRPAQSLRQIFLPWHPQTTGKMEQRLGALDLLLKRVPAVGWSLCISLLPHFAGDHSGEVHRPRWRDWAEGWKSGVTRGEYFAEVEQVSRRLAEHAGQHLERWLELIPALDRLPPGVRDQLVDSLADVGWGGLSQDEQARLAGVLRRVLHSHREYAEAGWAMPESVLDKLERVYEELDQGDPVKAVAWLFSQTPNILRPPPARNFEKRFEAEHEARVEALSQVLRGHGAPAVVGLAEVVPEPWILGRTAGSIPEWSNVEAEILARAESARSRAWSLFVRGFASVRSRDAAFDWYERVVGAADSGRISAGFAGLLLSEMEFEGPTWDRLDAAPETVCDSYWKQVSAGFVRHAERDAERAVRALLAVKRPRTAFSLLSSTLYARGNEGKVSPMLIIEVLDGLLGDSAEEASRLEAHAVAHAFAVLHRSSVAEDQRLVRLEWLFLPMLRHGEAGPERLYRELNESPEFFLEVLFTVFPPEGVEDHRPLDERRASAERGYQLLHSWPGIPGQDGEGVALSQWIKTVRSRARERGRLAICDEAIGWMLARAPLGSDGAWPHEAIREVVEVLESEELERGILIGVSNSRGVVTKAIGEGGRQERELATRYALHAEKLDLQWPRVAAMLRSLAEDYRRYAEREDRRARVEEHF